MTEMNQKFLAGTANRIITPPLGCQMAGFDARKGTATDVHDDLHARALVLDDGRIQVALLSLEVIGVDRELADDMRGRFSANTGIPASNIVIAATHTHCGPVTFQHFFNQGQPLDSEYIRHLADQAVAAAEEAFAKRKPASIRAGMVPAEGIARNRRTDDGEPADREAGVIVVEDADGSPVAVLVQFSCHTTVLGPNTLSISADFPYGMGVHLRQALGDNVEVMFFNGAEGDISVGHKSDLSAVGVIAPFRTFEKAQELGVKLGSAVLEGLAGLAGQAPRLAVAQNTAMLPLKTYMPLAELTEQREAAHRELAALDQSEITKELLMAKQRWLFARIEEYYARLFEDAAGEGAKTLAAKLTAVRVGDVVLLSFPGEVFHGIGAEIRLHSPFAATMFLGLANDYIGYIPTADANASLGYEVVASRVTPDAASVLVNAADELLQSLKIGQEA